MKVSIEYGNDFAREFEGDIVEIMPLVMNAVRDGLIYGDYIVVTTEQAEMHSCRKCGPTVSTRARRGQATEATKDYYVCPKCGYIKEGVVP
jgi:predicted RNA-binding Zn-ribbon protein involved in translation (DUF1610 family)